MATLNLEPTISTRYRIERVMYRGRTIHGIEAAGSYTAPAYGALHITKDDCHLPLGSGRLQRLREDVGG